MNLGSSRVTLIYCISVVVLKRAFFCEVCYGLEGVGK
jgi:hypothetical protein